MNCFFKRIDIKSILFLLNVINVKTYAIIVYSLLIYFENVANIKSILILVDIIIIGD